MTYLFDPDELHAATRKVVGLGTPRAQFAALTQALAARYPGHVRFDDRWLFNNAGGAMGAMTLLHASLSEYLIFFGTPIGTEGHSGRYRAQVYDFLLDGEMWCYVPGEAERTVYRPGDAAHLDRAQAKGYRIPDHAWMLEYARGPIPLMLPFGVADSALSTLDYGTIARTLWRYGRLATRELLLKGKV
jgi:C-8 sterol isomerase